MSEKDKVQNPTSAFDEARETKPLFFTQVDLKERVDGFWDKVASRGQQIKIGAARFRKFERGLNK